MKRSFTLFLAALLGCMCAYCEPWGPNDVQLMKSNLNLAATDGSTTLLDGDLTQYDLSFSNTVDGMDAKKMSNFSENIGMERGTNCLVIERRHTISNTDTIFYKIWNLTAQRTYQLALTATNLVQPGLSAYVEDIYLHTKVPVVLDGSSLINFSINTDAASSDPFRFRLIFTTAVGGTLPITFTGLKAYEDNMGVMVQWNTTSESDIKSYAVERSVDGKNFSGVAINMANNLSQNKYSYQDAAPATGINYYRIKSTDVNGDIKFSEVISVDVEKGFSLINIYPNPVVNKTINLRIINEQGGQYLIKLMNNFGQLVFAQKIQYSGGSNTIAVTPSHDLPKGVYHLQITKPGGTYNILNMIYE